jgi:hypothetical protein
MHAAGGDENKGDLSNEIAEIDEERTRGRTDQRSRSREKLLLRTWSRNWVALAGEWSKGRR